MVYNIKVKLNIEHIFVNFVTNPSVYRLLFPQKEGRNNLLFTFYKGNFIEIIFFLIMKSL